MKKFFKKIDDLINSNVIYPNSDYISGADIINTYMSMYNKDLEQLSQVNISEKVKCFLGHDRNIYLKWDDNKVATMFIKNNNPEEDLMISYNCRIANDPEFIFSSGDKSIWTDELINMINNAVKDNITLYAQKNIDFMRNYDKTHKAMYSVNSNIYLYLINNEAILFLDNKSYVDIVSVKSDSITINLDNVDIPNKLAIINHEEKFLNNMYFNINDVPEFMKEKLFEIREQQLLSYSENDLNKKGMSRKRAIKRNN